MNHLIQIVVIVVVLYGFVWIGYAWGRSVGRATWGWDVAVGQTIVFGGVEYRVFEVVWMQKETYDDNRIEVRLVADDG